MIKEIRDYFADCEILDELGLLDVDFLDNQVGSYSIEIMPGNPIDREYSDGGSIRQINLVIASREFYGRNINIDNSEFYENLEDWIEEQNHKRNFPKIKSGIPIKIEVTTPGYLFSVTKDTARYQIQLKFKYYKEAYK